MSEPVESARGDALTGNYDANVISGVRKPRVLAVYEWTEAAWRRQRAEVLTLLPGAVCSHDNVPPSDLALSDDCGGNSDAPSMLCLGVPHADRTAGNGHSHSWRWLLL